MHHHSWDAYFFFVLTEFTGEQRFMKNIYESKELYRSIELSVYVRRN